MRISDWSSDVCSSDLVPEPGQRRQHRHDGATDEGERRCTVEVAGPRLVVAAGKGDDVERSGQHVGPDRNVGERRVQGLAGPAPQALEGPPRSAEHTSELQSLMRISYAVFCLKNKKTHTTHT